MSPVVLHQATFKDSDDWVRVLATVAKSYCAILHRYLEVEMIIFEQNILLVSSLQASAIGIFFLVRLSWWYFFFDLVTVCFHCFRFFAFLFLHIGGIPYISLYNMMDVSSL